MIPIMKAILLFSIVLKALNLGMVSSLFIHRAHGTPYGAEFENGIREAEGPYADIHMGQGSNAESLSQVANNQSPVTKDGREAGPKSCMKKKTKDKMDGTQVKSVRFYEVTPEKSSTGLKVESGKEITHPIAKTEEPETESPRSSEESSILHQVKKVARLS